MKALLPHRRRGRLPPQPSPSPPSRAAARARRRGFRGAAARDGRAAGRLRHAPHPVGARPSDARDRRGAQLDRGRVPALSRGRAAAASGSCGPATRSPAGAFPTRPWSRMSSPSSAARTRPDQVVIITGHIDSRVTDPMNATADAPGANDDGSGTAAVIEAARVLSRHRFAATIVYAAAVGRGAGADRRQDPRRLCAGAGLAGRSPISTTTSSATAAARTGSATTPMSASSRKGCAGRAATRSPRRQRSLGGENDSPVAQPVALPRQPRRRSQPRPRRAARSGATTASAAAATIPSS